MFWRQVLPQTSPLLRRIASLAAQLILIALMVTGLTQLYLAPDTGSRKIYVIVDNSPSMANSGGEQTRLAEAIEHARHLIDELRIGDQMAIYVNSPATKPVCRLTSYRKELHASLEAISIASHQNDRWQRAFAKTSDTNTQFIFISDGCSSISSETIGPTTMHYVLVGQKADNVAITRLATRRGLFDTSTAEVMVEVQSYSDAQVELPLVMLLDDAEMAKENIPLPSNAIWRKTFRISGVSHGIITARIDIDDGLQIDNTVTASLPLLETISVKIVGNAPEAISESLAAIPHLHIAKSDEPADIHLYYNQPLPVELETSALVINPNQDDRYWRVGQHQYDIEVVQNHNSPLVRGLSLDEAVYERVRALKPIGDVHIAALARSGGEEFPLLFSVDTKPRVVIFAADVTQSDLQHRRDLPKLLANAAAWLNPLAAEYHVGISAIDDHELRPPVELSEQHAVQANLLQYPWWYWPCWYMSIGLVIALLPLEWWLYQRRMIA